MDNNNELNMERVWKEFGKHTEAGKLLYNIYGKNYKPQDHIHYPKLLLKTPEMKEKERLEKERLRQLKANKAVKAARQIDYTSGLRPYHKESYNPYGRVDYMPHKRSENKIKYEMNIMKAQIDQNVKANCKIGPNRNEKILNLQNRFEFQEGTSLPKGVRMPGLKLEEYGDSKINPDYIKRPPPKTKEEKERDELESLYNKIVEEIDDRYKYMDEMKKLGKNVDAIMMAEIKERIGEMKTVQKLIEEHDAKYK